MTAPSDPAPVSPETVIDDLVVMIEAVGLCLYSDRVRESDVEEAKRRLQAAIASQFTRALAEAVAAERATLSPSLTFRMLADANRLRADRWHHGDMNLWSPNDWAVALAGEVGEACNALKKLRRVEDGIAQVSDEGRLLDSRAKAIAVIAEELADTMLYLDLVAQRLGIDLEAATIAKFNSVSAKYDFPERLNVVSAGPAPSAGEAP